MQNNILCTARRLPCDARLKSIASPRYLRGLGFTSCLRGTQLGRPNQNYHFPVQQQPKTLRRGQPVQAFVVPPALIRIAQKVVFRGASGRLLIETAKKGGWRFAAPLTFLLFIYSIVATWFAAWQTKRAHKLARIADGNETDTLSPALASVGGAPGGDASSSSVEHQKGQKGSDAPETIADACPICHGRGTITWDRFETKEGALCPRCLGKGTLKKSFFG